MDRWEWEWELEWSIALSSSFLSSSTTISIARRPGCPGTPFSSNWTGSLMHRYLYFCLKRLISSKYIICHHTSKTCKSKCGHSVPECGFEGLLKTAFRDAVWDSLNDKKSRCVRKFFLKCLGVCK